MNSVGWLTRYQGAAAAQGAGCGQSPAARILCRRVGGRAELHAEDALEDERRYLAEGIQERRAFHVSPQHRLRCVVLSGMAFPVCQALGVRFWLRWHHTRSSGNEVGTSRLIDENAAGDSSTA